MQPTFPDFATVLKEVEADQGPADDIRGPQFGFASAVFSASLSDIGSPPEAAPDPEHERQEIAARMQSQSADAIRRELDLQPGLKRAELQRRRRSFAARNHPDRLPEEFRPAAEQRMKTANALLDKAMAEALR